MDEKKQTKPAVEAEKLSAAPDLEKGKLDGVKETLGKAVRTTKRIVLRTLLVASLLGLAGVMIYANMTYSSGDRVGKVIKLSNKGIFFKTWEGQLNQGYQEKWDFSIPKSQEQVRVEIDKAVEKDLRVKMFYKEKYIALPWRGDTKYLVYKVEILGD